VFIIICIVVGVVIWGLVQMCKKIPPPPPPDDGQPSNITSRIHIGPADRIMQFQFDLPTAGSNYFAGGNVTDEVGNTYILQCSYKLYCASNANGPWSLDGLVTNWMGGTMTTLSNGHYTVSLTNQEVALYDTNGSLASARRWAVSGDLSNCIQPRIVMPPQHFPAEFYRVVLLEQ
jgi:hypothetical protein